MARGDSIIRVSIIGDAKQLNTTLATVDTKLGTLSKVAAAAGGAFLASRVVGEAFDIGAEALDKADTFADSMDRIAGTLSPEVAQRIHDVAFDMTDLGLSADEVGTLAANFADLATAAGVSAPLIGDLTPKMLEIAAAVSATTGKPLDEVITDIGKAAAGNQKPVSEYGVVVDKALNPDARLLDILQQLEDKMPDVKSATDDYAGAQETLNAKWDNLLVKLGEGLEGPLKDTLDWINDMVDAAPGAFGALDKLADKIHELSPASFPNLGSLFDLLGGIVDRVSHINQSAGGIPEEQWVVNQIRRNRERNGLTN